MQSFNSYNSFYNFIIWISKYLSCLFTNFPKTLLFGKVLRLAVILLQQIFLYIFLKFFVSGSWQLFNTKNRFYIPEVRFPYTSHFKFSSDMISKSVIPVSVTGILFSEKYPCDSYLPDSFNQIIYWINFTSWISIPQTF